MKTTIVLALSLAACADANDARLDHAQILAVRAEPASVAPGQRARIDVLAGDDAGNVYEVAPDSLTATGMQGPLPVEKAADGWYVTATEPGVARLAVTLSIDGTRWPATKSLVVGESHDNPHVGMQIDGAEATEMSAAKGTKPSLTAVASGIEPFTYAWYSSVGDLAAYRQQTAELDAADAADGAVVLVVRDALGGVAWQMLPATVK